MDLSTTYMGLHAAQPARRLRVSALADRSTASGGWPTPASARSCCSRCSRSSCAAEAAQNARLADAGTESFAESLSYFPGGRRDERRPAPLPEPARARRRRRRHPGDRQPERRHAGRLDRLRPRDAGGRRGRDRAQHLLPPRRPAHPRPRRRAAPPRHPRARQGRGQRAGRGQAEPVLQLDRRDGAAAGRRPAPTRSSCSTASCSPTSTRRRSP